MTGFSIFVAAMLVVAKPATGQTDSESEAMARHVRKARAAVEADDYRTAARHFLAAHAVSRETILLYNAAYAFARVGRLRRAREVARRARDEELPNAELAARNAARIRGWSATLRGRSSAQRLAQTESAQPRRRESGWGVRETTGTIGAAIGAVALGGVLILDGQIDRRVERRERAGVEGRRREVDRLTTEIENRQIAGRVLTVAGGTLLAGGGTMLIWGLLDKPDSAAALRPGVRLSPGREVGIGVRLVF
jgi:hypothetical protein